MQTQIDWARQGVITEAMAEVAKQENVPPEQVREAVARGEAVVLAPYRRPAHRVVGIGAGLRTKVNGSIGTSSELVDVEAEVRKARIIEEEGADTLMELSTGGDLDEIRRRVLAAVELPVGTVPLYQAFAEAIARHRNPNRLDPEHLFEVIERQLDDGVRFMAIHCGINRYTLERLERQGYRYGGLVSKGGTYLVSWMTTNDRENPLYEQFDRVAALMKRYDAVLSLGNGIRAGAIDDSHDRAQVAEMVVNCELAEIGREMGVQTMVEGPGHVPLHEIEANILLEKRLSGNAPYYVLGPLPLDTGAGYDHITAAIGAAHAARCGADLVCYITPAEHLGLPDEHDVREGVRATRLAVRAGDATWHAGVREEEKRMALARRDLDWRTQAELALFGPEVFRRRLGKSLNRRDGCTMCGDFCAMVRGRALFQAHVRGDKQTPCMARAVGSGGK